MFKSRMSAIILEGSLVHVLTPVIHFNISVCAVSGTSRPKALPAACGNAARVTNAYMSLHRYGEEAAYWQARAKHTSGNNTLKGPIH